MRSRANRFLLAAVAVGIAVTTLPATETAAVGPADADVVSSAHAAEGTARRFDPQSAVVQLTRDGRARASASASSTCTGCDADARTVQIVYAQAPRIASDNVAAAWATCTDCSTSSVSVQVVILGKRPTDLVLANRALAVNAACDGCTTGAAAAQFVISGGNRHELSEAARALIEGMATDLSLALEMPAPGRRSAQVTSGGTGASSLKTLAATSPEARSIERVAAALRAEFGQDAVTVNLDLRREVG